MVFKIRRVRCPKNSETLSELDKKIFPDCSGFAEPRSAWWLVYNEDGKAIGFAGVSILHAERAFLCRCGLLPEARGYGLQKRLIRLRESYCRKRDIKTIVTYVSRDNVRSANNLIKEGYLIYMPKAEWGLPVADATYFKKEL